MPFSSKDFEDLMRNASVVNEISHLAEGLFKFFEANDISPPMALGAMAYAIGVMMGHDGRELNDIYPVIDAAYKLADHKARGGKK